MYTLIGSILNDRMYRLYIYHILKERWNCSASFGVVGPVKGGRGNL